MLSLQFFQEMKQYHKVPTGGWRSTKLWEWEDGGQENFNSGPWRGSQVHFFSWCGDLSWDSAWKAFHLSCQHNHYLFSSYWVSRHWVLSPRHHPAELLTAQIRLDCNPLLPLPLHLKYHLDTFPGWPRRALVLLLCHDPFHSPATQCAPHCGPLPGLQTCPVRVLLNHWNSPCLYKDFFLSCCMDSSLLSHSYSSGSPFWKFFWRWFKIRPSSQAIASLTSLAHLPCGPHHSQNYLPALYCFPSRKAWRFLCSDELPGGLVSDKACKGLR